MYHIKHNSARCIGCYACEVHCKVKNQLPAGPRLCRIKEDNPVLKSGIPTIRYTFHHCFQCVKPKCVPVCPSKALRKRKNDGIVVIDPKLCIGCQACIAACPWHIPQFQPETGKVVKCDACLDRLRQGLIPACVSKCTAHALKWEEGVGPSAHE